MSGENNSMFGRKHKESTIKLIKDNHPDVSGENNPMFGIVPEKKKCPFCGKFIDIRNYSRWHGNKCKKR
jgi:hypothetical protein